MLFFLENYKLFEIRSANVIQTDFEISNFPIVCNTSLGEQGFEQKPEISKKALEKFCSNHFDDLAKGRIFEVKPNLIIFE